MANRRRRAEIKDQIKAGALSWAGLLGLAQTDDVVAAIQVRDALQCFPGIGPKRVERFMTQAHISRTRRLRGLGQRQVAVLNDVLNR